MSKHNLRFLRNEVIEQVTAQRIREYESKSCTAVTFPVPVEEIIELQRLVRAAPVGDELLRYAVALVRGSRVGEPDAAEAATRLAWGAGPRAVQFLVLGAKARALMDGRPCVELDDLRALAKPVLRHRLVLSFESQTEGITPDDLVDQLLAATPTSDQSLRHDPRFRGVLAG